MQPALLCHLDELPDGGSRGFDPTREGRDSVFVVRQGSRLHAWRNACPHVDGAPMAWRKDAYLNHDRTRIVCSAHGALFDIATGLCVLGPCIGQRLTPVALDLSAAGEIRIAAGTSAPIAPAQGHSSETTP